MTWLTIKDTGLTGLDGLIIYCANAWAGFTPLVLFCIFLIVLLGSYFIGKKTEGDGNIAGSFFAASFFTLVIATFMTLISQTVGAVTYVMINGITISVTIAVFVISLIIFLVDRV